MYLFDVAVRLATRWCAACFESQVSWVVSLWRVAGSAFRIQQDVKRLPAAFQAEALDFVEYLLAKAERSAVRQEERAWSDLSLTSAMRGMEDKDTPTYISFDLRVLFS